MKLDEARQRNPQIAALYSIIEDKKIKLTALPTNPKLDSIYFREIEFSSQDFSAIIPLDDEYEDVEKGNQALMLQLIIYAVEEYEDREDFLVWSTAFGLNSNDPFILNMYRDLGKTIPKIRDIIGTDINDISDYDWELNAGAAQALRELDQ
ncbi:MAG TPA: hypothetical protein DCL80_06240 [Balneola sp.]|jgi:hypothetical protein|nr:hypothetical protein [Balneola sp.]MAO77507.1 hypothetical protein [Balneola sp.]MBF66016.1 hypothetical protein [Balneola sp.]HAH50875.1 hypothetical protein [Balneola sp.]HBZ38503.1 hypothetical protein [Balneola sp.]|tara:strand:- start:6690 stop:7142 length:453 start_codon:yes stop_codon:yes gene_type:complete